MSAARAGSYVFAGTLAAVGVLFVGMEIGSRQTLAEIDRRAERPRIPVESVDILKNESCIETARACYARKRMERVKVKEG
jgi:hypothetical protein